MQRGLHSNGLFSMLFLFCYFCCAAEDVVAFVGSFTRHVDGVGDVCSFAAFDLQVRCLTCTPPCHAQNRTLTVLYDLLHDCSRRPTNHAARPSTSTALHGAVTPMSRHAHAHVQFAHALAPSRVALSNPTHVTDARLSQAHGNPKYGAPVPPGGPPPKAARSKGGKVRVLPFSVLYCQYG